MTRMTLDVALSQQLHQLTRPVELCDLSGRILGRFIPQIGFPAGSLSRRRSAKGNWSDGPTQTRSGTLRPRCSRIWRSCHVPGRMGPIRRE